jgi:hypothetical protein
LALESFRKTVRNLIDFGIDLYHLEASLAPKSSQNREKEGLRSLVGNHLEKGSQNDEKRASRR